MNKYQCQVCGAVSYSAASQENLKDNSCLECDGRVEMVEGDKMNADEIMRALRKAQEDYKNDIVSVGRIRIDKMARDCADCIESLQAQLAEEKIASQSLRNAANGYKAQLAASQRRERAAVEDMKVMALAMRESDELSEGCCFACVCDGQNLPGNVILPYGECPGYDTNDCFEWRGPLAGKGE